MARKPMGPDVSDLTDYIKDSFIPRIEEEHGVEILIAVESGSRMWGFPSKDSDYDIRFIYRHRDIRCNFSVGSHGDVIDQKDPNPLIDATGWDVGKSIYLMSNGNGTLVDWLNSPLVYARDAQAEAHIRLLQEHLLTKSWVRTRFIYHHRSLAKKTYKLALENADPMSRLSAKKILYATRSALISYWCEKYLSTTYSWAAVPTIMDDLLKIIPDGIRSDIKRLISAKKEARSEKSAFMCPGNYGDLMAFIEASINRSPLPAAEPDFDKSVCTAILRSVIMKA